MALTYREVLDRYDKAKAFGETKTLPEFAQNLNSALNTEDYSQGLRDGPWTRFSTRLDQVLGGASPYGEVVNSAGGAAADVLGALGGATGQAFGYGDVGEKVGRSLPRSLLETAPLYLAGPEAGIPATIAAALGTGLLMGGHTYADTGNKKQALLQGAVGAALPTIGKIGGNVGARLAGGEKVVGELAEGGVINSVLPATADSAGQVAAGRFAGSQLAQLGTQVGQQYGDSRITGEKFQPFTAESIAAQLPFTVFDAVHAVTGKVPTVGEIKLKTREEVKPQDRAPSQSSPEAETKRQAYLDALTDPTVDPSVAVGNAVKVVMGEVPMARTPAPVVDDTVTLSGFSQKGAKSHKFYVQDSSHPEDFAPGSTVFLNGEFNSTTDPDPTNKTEYVAIPKSRIGKNVQFPIIPEDHAPKVDPNQPLLPTRPEGVEPTPLAGVGQVFHPAEQRVLDEMGLDQKALAEVVQRQPRVQHDLGYDPQGVPKRGNLVLDMFQGKITADNAGNVRRLGTTDVSKNGWMGETRFVKAAQVPQGLLPAFKEMYPEAFNNRGEVNATALVKALQERPMVEVKKLGGVSPSTSRKGQILHALDTEFPEWERRANDGLEPRSEREATLIRQLDANRESRDVRSDEPKYSFLGPKAEKDMPGYVEGLVRIPTKPVAVEKGKFPSQAQDAEAGLKYAGPHFGTEDTNVLAFFRGYEETLPTGEKAFHVVEVQSDWGQANRKAKDKRAEVKLRTGATEDQLNGDEALRSFDKGAPDHALLASYETLALKAAIDHATSVGATKIILPDAETAMMTEGHDKAAQPNAEGGSTLEGAVKVGQWGVRNSEGKLYVYGSKEIAEANNKRTGGKLDQVTAQDLDKKVSQAGGMTLHYDTTLPDAARKLTGDVGQKVELGVHKGAQDTGNRIADFEGAASLEEQLADGLINQSEYNEAKSQQGNVIGSPVFKNPDGTPKSSITGRVYDLAKIQSADPTLSIKESVHAYELAKAKEVAARERATRPLEDSVSVVENLSNVPAAKAKMEETSGTPTQKVQAAVLVEATKEVDTAQQTQALEKHKVLSLWNDREQNEYGGGIVDAEGKRMKFNTRAAALEYLTEWQADPTNTDSRDYVVRNAGRNRGYYLAPIENQQVSMDAVRGEGGESSLHNVVTQASEDVSQNLSTPGYDIQDRPEVSQRSTMEQLDHALTHPEAFSEVSDFDAEDAPHVLAQAKLVFDQALKDGELNLKNINSALEAQGLDTFDSLFELKGFRKDVVTGLDGMQGVFRSPTLGSAIPYDRDLVSQIGFEKGARNVVDWIVNENIPVISDLVAGFRNFPDILDRVQFITKGDPRWKPNDMFFLMRNEGPTINLGRFPREESRMEYAKDLAHELAHHMDIESTGRVDAAAVEYNETKSQLLDTMRKTRNIPKDVKATVELSLKEDWYGKNSEEDPFFGRVVAALGEDKAYDWFQVIYALQNEQELVAQSFSSHQFIALMNETKTKQETGLLRSALNIFSRAFAKMFRLKDESALGTLLTSFDNYLTAGNLRNTYNGREFIRDSLFDQGVHPDAVASRLWTVDRLFTKGNLLPSISGFVREGEVGALPPDSQKNFAPLDQGVRTALVSGDTKAVYDKTMSLLADQLPAHQELLFRMKQDLEVANGLFREIREGRVPGTIPQGAEKELSLSRAKVSRMEAAMNKQALAVQRWNEIEGLTPEGWGRDVAAQLGEKFGSPTNDLPEGETIRTVLAKERAAGKRSLSWFAKTFALTQHFAEIYPAAKTVISRVSTLQGDAIARMRLLTTSFFFDPSKPREGGSGNVDPEIKKQATRVLKSERLLEVTSDLFRWQNQEGQSRALNLNDGFVKKRLAGLNDSDRAAVLQMVQSQKNRHIAWTGMLGNGLGQMNEANTGTLIAASEPGMLPETARDLSRQMYSALAQAVQPETAQVGAQSLAALAQKMSADTYLKTLQHVQTLSTKTKDYMEYVQKNPGYVSEQRYGSDKLVMIGPDGQKSTDSGTNTELQKIQKKREKEGYSVLDYIAAEDATSSRFGMTPQLLQKLEALDSTNENLVRQMLSPEVAATVLPRISRAGDIRASMAASAPLPTVKRAFREGRENINMLNNANQFYQRSNNWLRNRLVQAESALDMMHPEVAGNPELTNYLNKHVEEFTTPDNPTARKFVEATSFAKLGMDFGNSLIEMTQHLTTGMAELIKETGSVSDAIGLVAKTSKNIWQSRVTKKWANPEHKILDDYLQERGHGSLAHWGDFADPEVLNAVDVNANPVVKSAGFAKHMAKSWSSAFSGYNDQVIAHAAFDIGRSQGMDIESALQFADSVKARGLYTGGKAQRAVGLWDIKTKAVPQLMNALQSYTLGWFGQMGKNFVLGFGKAPQGLTETQRLGAKKAFAYSLIAQAALAGGLGLPAVGQGLALFSQITGIDGKGWIRQNLAKLFDEDDGGNQILTSLAMRGVGSAGLPFDPSGRVSVSIPFIGVDAYKGFDVANLGGAVTSTVADFVKGGLGLLGGDVAAGAGLLPNVLKRPYQLWQGEGDIRDKRGGLLYKLTPAESVMMALGITPSGVQNQRDAAEAVKKANDTAQKKAEAMADDIATTFRKAGDQAGRQKIVEAKQANPNLDVKALLTSVQNRIIAQQQPYDPRRELRSDANIDGLNLGLPPSEIVRQQMAASARNSVGLQPRLSRPSKAAALDEYLGANPYSSLSGARSAVQTGIGGRGRSSLQTVPAYLQGSL